MSIMQIKVKGNRIGISGLGEIFEELKEAQISDKNELKELLFQKVKKYNYVAEGAEEDYKIALYREYRRFLGEEVEEDETGLIIKILGPGCPMCERLENEIIHVLEELNLSADLEHVRDVKEIAKYGILGTPALIINQKVKCSGRVPMRSQLKKWIFEIIKEGEK